MNRCLFLLFIVALPLCLAGQNVTVINNYDRPESEVNKEEYVLKKVSRETIVINDYELSNASVRTNLEQMIAFGLRAYIDAEFYALDGSISSDIEPTAFIADATDVVKNAIWIHDQPFYNDFADFGQDVRLLAAELHNMDLYKIKIGREVMDEPRNSTIGLYAFQLKVYDLKMATELQVSLFLNNYLPHSNQVIEKPDIAYLKPKDFQLTQMDVNTARLGALKPDFDLLLSAKEQRKLERSKNKRGNDNNVFSERIVALLEENNRILSNYNNRFESIQSEIDQLKAGKNNGNSDIKDEIAELRKMILDLSNGKEITQKDGSKTRLVSSEGPTVVFEKNVYRLSMAQKAILNQVDATLILNPEYTALITGYADKTGDANFNAWISKKRAEAVMEYLKSRGIEQNRLIINFFGDDQSLSANPEDRKVNVRFIQNYAAKP